MFLMFREAFRTIRRNPGTWSMTALTLAVILGVSGLFALLAIRGHLELVSLQKNLSVEAFFDPSLASEACHEIVDRDVSPIAQIARVSFISKEQALLSFSKSSGENVEEVLGVNPLPASVTIWLKDPSASVAAQIEGRLRGINGITEVKSDLDLLRTMESRAVGLDRLSVTLVSLLLLCAVFFILTSARLSIHSRRDALHAMSMLGATRGVLAGPFAIEGALAGLVGGCLGAGFLLLVQAEAFSAIGGLRLIDSSHDTILLFTVLGAVGLIFTGLFSGFFSLLKTRNI